MRPELIDNRDRQRRQTTKSTTRQEFASCCIGLWRFLQLQFSLTQVTTVMSAKSEQSKLPEHVGLVAS